MSVALRAANRLHRAVSASARFSTSAYVRASSAKSGFRQCSTSSSIIGKQEVSQSQSQTQTQTQQAPLPPPKPSAPSAPSSPASKAFKFLFGTSILAATGTALYVSYAYSTEQIEEIARVLEKERNYTVPDDASILDKISGFIYAQSMTASSKATELYLDARKAVEEHVRGFSAPTSDKLLPDLAPQEQHVFTLVLDLNETLIYSDWKRERGWKTFKRPGVDAFLEHLGQFYEIVVYSDQLSMYVDPILERLDQKGYIRHRLSRDATQYINGKHYRDLSKLNRDPAKVIYISGHALESCLQSENALQIKPWTLEQEDTTLLDLIPFLEYVARHHPSDLRTVLSSYQGYDVPTEFRRRSLDHQRRLQEQKQQGRFWNRGN